YYPPKVYDPYYSVLTEDYIGFIYKTTVTGTEEWVPCEEMPLCGAYPNPTRRGGGRFPSKGSSYGYELEYDNLESGCRVRFEVVALDTAGNSSTPYQPISMTNDPHRQYSQESGMNVGSWDVPTPRCKTFC